VPYYVDRQGQEPERDPNFSREDYSHSYSHNNPEMIDVDNIDDITLADYGYTSNFLKGYMFGLKIEDPATGKEMGDDFYEHFLETAINQAEQDLDIAIIPRALQEHHDYRSQEFNSYMHTHAYRRPILQVQDLKIEYNGRTMYSYPSDWIKTYHLFGHVEVSPSPLTGSLDNYRGAAHANPLYGFYNMGVHTRGKTFAPKMVHLDYIAGMLPRKNRGYNKPWEVPATLDQYIAKLALKEVFQQWGRLLIQPGLASTSINIDGVSQSMGTTQSAQYSAMSAELGQITSDIDDLRERLKSYFGDNPLITV